MQKVITEGDIYLKNVLDQNERIKIEKGGIVEGIQINIVDKESPEAKTMLGYLSQHTCLRVNYDGDKEL